MRVFKPSKYRKQNHFIIEGLNLKNFKRPIKHKYYSCKLLNGYYYTITTYTQDDIDRCYEEKLPFLTYCHEDYMEKMPDAICQKDLILSEDIKALSMQLLCNNTVIKEHQIAQDGSYFDLKILTYEQGAEVYKIEIYEQ